MAQKTDFIAHCSHCGAAFPLKDVNAGETVNTWCPSCGEFLALRAPLPTPPSGGTKKQPAAPPKENKKSHLGRDLLIMVASVAVGSSFIPLSPVCCAIFVISFIMVIYDVVVLCKRKKSPSSPQKVQNAGRAQQAPNENFRVNTTAAPQSASASKSSESYGKYGKLIASADFKKLEGYLLDADRILSHAQDMAYENGPRIVLRDTDPGKEYGQLEFEVLIYHRTDVSEFNLPAADIVQVKKDMAAKAFTPEGGANPYSKIEKQFVTDVYGADYKYKAPLPLCYDPDDGQWVEEGRYSHYSFRRKEVFSLKASGRKKLLQAAKCYWEANHMAYGMSFVC